MKRVWVPYIAAIGAVVAIALAASALLAGYRAEHARERLDTGNAATESQRVDAARLCEARHNSPPLIDSCVVAELQRLQIEKRDEYDLKAQQEMAEWAFAVFMATFVGLFISAGGILGLVWTLREQRKLGRDQARAYLELADATLEITEQGTLRLELSVFNGGQTPARHLHARAEFTYLSHTDDEGRDMAAPAQHVLQSDLEIVGAKSSDVFDARGQAAFSLDFLRAHKGSSGGLAGTEKYEGPRVRIRGTIHYSDAFARSQSLSFYVYKDWVVNTGRISLDGIRRRQWLTNNE